jgi:hypothetical protein
MPKFDYRIEWSRPVPDSLPGERSYHATDGITHILVIVTANQLLAAKRLAEVTRSIDPEASIQQIIEDALNRAIATRLVGAGEVRLNDEDFL